MKEIVHQADCFAYISISEVADVFPLTESKGLVCCVLRGFERSIRYFFINLFLKGKFICFEAVILPKRKTDKQGNMGIFGKMWTNF